MSNHNKRILIDAVYQDGIRVAVLRDGQVVEFDQESKDKKCLKGNVYCAVVKRIEPSLQAVFIEYGANKHGFLPFSEISLDYYNISEEEKEKLYQILYEDSDIKNDDDVKSVDDSVVCDNKDQDDVNDYNEKLTLLKKDNSKGSYNKSKLPFYKLYKVQDVIKLEQKLMAQIIKEERGNKGATFSTFITLVGRYCIFMPNSGNKNSGISRRIEDADDRKTLKNFLNVIKLPKESGMIIRTAGSNKSQKEIEQDLSYLQSTWRSIQNSYVSITVPSLLYVEGDIIKRTLRDYCDENTQDIIVSGSYAYELAKECVKFMFRNRVRLRIYKGSVPIFSYYKIESQICELYGNIVNLPSGGYMVITPTEALVSIDVNSGKMTGEDSIEETAYKTNMEAVKEIARQVNLRGLSGLIVIDFIDMLKYRYCRSVESEIKEAFKYDKAKVQFGYISTFGLMEISRQRVKQSILEANTVQCSHCNGVGRVRSLESSSGDILRDIRYCANKNRNKLINISVAGQMIEYFFNNKRQHIAEIEEEFSVSVKLTVNQNTSNISDFNINVENDDISNQNKDVVNIFTVDYKISEDNKLKEEMQDTSTGSMWIKKWLTRIFSSI
ncbi:Rne/Rng family ribonuclease [Ehrlichia canis]|uniref:RNAse E n=1 Tax=Ehrlichia canis (strain Jake) TaxID=269484 RepID=A0ACA6AW59_EHRCJ|nr:Rne/Rng family ribonuclease [Ehrlichia canis]AAZ68590.1 RNAse E [Ehrlichia canis str. Jake]AUO54674.1 ribonuclease E [Ehrlichia canis]UKC53059.1 Rne/Rng family ribonuclease [Ehrlichia canis]UKC53996.1 Rne/Rng family ribonuclease [Ehrlichia canis]UKC54932.1 Rne/Rng family ribonuclease [Ehrlichia canis]